MPKVSIIIPVYNAETYLRECLDSVINQTFKDIEIICIDDCSTDNSIDILKEYTEKDNRIKIHVQKQALDICRNSQYSDLFTKYYSISYIGSLLLWFKTWSKTDQTIEQDFYNRIKEAFIELDKLGIDSYIKKNIKKRVYKNYRSFINCSYRTYRLKTLPKRVIKNILSLFNKKNNLFCEVK